MVNFYTNSLEDDMARLILQEPRLAGLGLTSVVLIVVVLIGRSPLQPVFKAEIKHINYNKQVEVIVTGCCGAASQDRIAVTEIEFDRQIPIGGSRTTVVWLDSYVPGLRNALTSDRWQYQYCRFDTRHSEVPIICGLVPKG